MTLTPEQIAEQKAITDKAVADAVAAKEKELSEAKAQMENLNKGIAGYRDKAQDFDKITKELEELKKKNEEPKIELSQDEEAKMKAYAEKHGLVTKETLETERIKAEAANAKSAENQAVNEFLEAHPEFDDDAKFGELKAEFALYKTPTDLVGYRALLGKAYKNITGKDPKSQDARAGARAEIITRSRLSLGGRGGAAPEGGSAETIETLQARYPNLSKDIIEGRLAELKAMYKK